MMTSLATQIIDQQVSGIASRLKDEFSNELGLGSDDNRRRSTAFLFLVAKTMLGLDDDETLDGIVDGGNDYGIDALYFEPPDQGDINIQITLIQVKYKRDLRGESAFPENAIVKMIHAIETLFDLNLNLSKSVNKRLDRRIEEVRSFVREGAIPQVTAVAANNGLRWMEQAQQKIKNTEDRVGDQVRWQHVGSADLFAMLQAQARKSIDTELQLVGQSLVEPFEFRRVLMGRMSVAELARMTNEYGNHLFEKNIRRYLGLTNNRVNEAVANTLRQADQRSNFYFYNNGITITCSQFRHNALQKENWRVQVSGMQIVNGGQTARTVQQVAEEVGLEEIETAEVLVRIYELPQDDNNLVDAITVATNSQTPVEIRDLRANEPKQKALGKSISLLEYTYRAKREDRTAAPKELTSAVVAEAVLAIWRRRPHQARFMRRQHFGTLYNTIFTEELNGAQAILAALLHRETENRRKRPPEDAPDLFAYPDFLAYGSRFIAMLTGCYLLQDMGIDLAHLDHQNFDRAQKLIKENFSNYVSRAEEAISKALASLNNEQEPTLQRLSATFRRADLVEMLL